MDLTPNEVVQGLLARSRELAALTDDLDVVERDAINAREDYTLALAKAQISVPGDTVGERNARALLATHDERLAADLAEALVRGRKRQIDSVKVRIDVGRSAAAALRSELELDKVR